MKLKCFTSKTESAAAGCLIKSLTEFKPTDMVYILTPDNSTISVEEEIIKTLNINGYLNFQVLTLDILVNKLTKQNFINKKPMSGFMASVVIKNIVQTSELEFFGKAKGNLGFAIELYNTILQIKASGITPEQLKLSAQKIKNKAAQLKFLDIALVYEKYEDYISGNLDGLSKFMQGAVNIKTSELAEESYFAFVHYNSLTSLQANILKELIKHSKGVLVSCRKNENQETSVNDVYNSLMDICYDIGIRPEILEEEDSDKENYKIFEAKNIYDETLHAGLLIKKELKNLKLEDITLAVNNLNIYKSTIEEVFKTLDIPIYINASTELSEFAIAKFVLNLISCYKTWFDCEKVIALTKNIFSGLNSFSAMKLENLILKKAITGDMFAEEKYFKDFSNFHSNFIKIIINEKENFNASTNCKGYAKSLNSVLSRLDIVNLNEKLIENSESESEKEILSVSFKKAMEILEELATLDLPVFITANEFETLVKTAFLKCELNLAPSVKPSLYVCDSFESFVAKNKVGFILGACDYSFPALKQDIGLISDDEIKQAENYSKIEPSIRKLNKLNLEKADELLNKFETCYISFSKTVNGEDRRESLILNNLKEKFKIETEIIDLVSMQETMDGFFNAEITEALAKQIWFKLFAKKANKKQVLDEELVNSLGKIFYNSWEFKMFEERFKVEAKEEVFFKNKEFSVTKLEKFFTCPLKHFLEKVLNLKERELGKIENVDVGIIYHEFLKKFGEYLLKHDVDEKNIKRTTDFIMKDVLNNPKYDELLNLNQNKFALKNIEEEKYKLAYNLFVHHKKSNFKPKPETKKCKNDGSLEMQIRQEDFEGTGLTLIGKIDKVDYLQENGKDTMFRVIDFKTKQSGKEFSLQNIYCGSELQLPVYTSIVSRQQNLKNAGMFFYPVVNSGLENEFTAKLSGPVINRFDICKNMDTDLTEGRASEIINAQFKTNPPGEPFKKMYSEEDINNITTYAKELLKAGTKEVLTGDIKPSVQNETTCKFCPFYIMGKCFKRDKRESLKVDKLSFKTEGTDD